MSEIPEDLKELYGICQAWRQSYGSDPRFGSGTVEVLVERIAALTAERDTLQTRLNEALATIERLKASPHGVTNLRGPLVLKHGDLCVGCQQVRDKVIAARSAKREGK